MPEDNQREKESGIRNQESGEKTAKEDRGFELKEQKSENKVQEAETKPQIPQEEKPEMPAQENIPIGGPGKQPPATGNQPSSKRPQTSQQKIKILKEEMSRPIPVNTPEERKESSKIEDRHNDAVLGQN